MASKKLDAPRWRVVGNHAVFDHPPGTVFAADLSAFDRDRLVTGGHIEEVTGNGN